MINLFLMMLDGISNGIMFTHKKSTSQRDAFELWILDSEFIFCLKEHCLLNRRRSRSLLRNDCLLNSCCLNHRKVLNSYLSHWRVWSMSCCCFCCLSCWKNCLRVLSNYSEYCLSCCLTVWSMSCCYFCCLSC